MKAKKPVKPAAYPDPDGSSEALNETAMAYPIESGPMIRTQIYLNRQEYDFVQSQARRRQEPMAAVIRNFIDDQMKIPAAAWADNPMLQPTPQDPGWKGHADGALNHDHYLTGAPKKWIKTKGGYQAAPPLPEDYYSNRASREAYDRQIRKPGAPK